MLKQEHKVVEKCHICLKEFNYPENRKVAITRIYIEGQPATIATLNIDCGTTCLLSFTT